MRDLGVTRIHGQNECLNQPCSLESTILTKDHSAACTHQRLAILKSAYARFWAVLGTDGQAKTARIERIQRLNTGCPEILLTCAKSSATVLRTRVPEAGNAASKPGPGHSTNARRPAQQAARMPAAIRWRDPKFQTDTILYKY